MRSFDMLKGKEKTYICERCKKEIQEDETKWIANCSFCETCAIPWPKQGIEADKITERRKFNAAVRAISELLSKQYYYITSDDSHRDQNLVFMLFLSRDKKALLGIETTKEPNNIHITMDKVVTLPLEVTETSLRECILSNFGRDVEEYVVDKILELIRAKVGYEFATVLRFESLFTTEDIPWRQHTTVGYDRVSGMPYLIERDYEHGGICARLITLKKVVDCAKEYAPDSKFTTITDENWETFIELDADIIDESTTFCDPLLYMNDIFCVMVSFREENGERLPLF